MSEFKEGLDDMMEEATENESNVVAMPVEKKKRRPFYEWTVAGNTYRMKLNTNWVCKLEDKYKNNLLNVVTGGNIPTLGTMLTIAQAAMVPQCHGIKYSDVQNLFDKYVEDGGDQLTFYSDVIMGVMGVSGFFTQSQAEAMSSKNLTEEMDMRL